MTTIVPISRNELTVRRLERRQPKLDVTAAHAGNGGKFSSQGSTMQLPATTSRSSGHVTADMAAPAAETSIDPHFVAQVIGQYTTQDDEIADPQDRNAAYQDWAYARRARPYPKPKMVLA